MEHEIHKVVSFKRVGPFTLRVDFEDDTSQLIDFSPLLRGKLYGPLGDESIFDQVKLDREVHTLVWPNGADFDPSILHDWPRRQASLERLARKWEKDAA